VSRYGRQHGLNILRQDQVAVIDHRPGAGGAQQGEGGPWAESGRVIWRAAGVLGDGLHIGDQCSRYMHFTHIPLQFNQLTGFQAGAQGCDHVAPVCAGQEFPLGCLIRIAHFDAHQETVELRLRQRESPDLVIGVLRGNHEEGVRQGARFPFTSDLVFLHGLQERALGFRRGAVDLVNQNDLGENRPGMELEAARVAVVYRHANDVRRQHVGGALDAVKVQTEQLGQHMSQDRLANARHVFDEQMATCQQADQGKADLPLFAQHNAAGLADCFVNWRSRHDLRRKLQSVDNGIRNGILLQFHCEKTRRGSGLQMTTAFITHRDCWLHDMGVHHPECPERLSAISDRLIAAGLDLYLSFYDAPLATLEQISRVHPPEYVRSIAESAPQSGIVHLDPDTAMSAGTLQAALRSAGAGVLATDLVMSGEVENAFCSVRPPGHHAERAKAMGFCFFNNIAIAATHALEVHGLERVAVIDFDVHHGNGTEDIFANDPRVLMVSTFQHPFYPYTGTDAPAANMINVPVPAGTRSEGFRDAVTKAWLPALRDFAPEAIFISAGFDAHYEDDMASLGLVEADYAWVTQQIKAIAAESAQDRIISMLEGGYALSALARSVTTHVKVLADL